MVNAVIFDFGRVISAWKPHSLFHSYERDLGLEPDTLNTIMFDSPLWEQALLGQMSMDEYWQAIGPALNLHGVQEIRSFQHRYYRDERRNEEVVQLIGKLSKNVRLAILSNHPSGLPEWLEDWGLTSFFADIVCSCDIGVAKPDRRAFEITLNQLSCSPGEVLFIDDTLEHVEAARGIGIHGILFTGARQLHEDLQLYFPDLST